MTLTIDPLDRQLHRNGLSPTSRVHYRYWLRRLVDFCGKPLQAIEFGDIEAFLKTHRFSPRTQRTILAATNILAQLQGRPLPVGVLYPPTLRNPHHPLSAEELERLLHALEARERLFVELLLETGQPVRKLLALRCRDMRDPVFQHSLSAPLRTRLHCWLEHIDPLELGNGYVFPGRQGPIKTDTLRKRIRQGAEAAGLERRVNLHVLRATALVRAANIQPSEGGRHDA